jgi:hypothetical protein
MPHLKILKDGGKSIEPFPLGKGGNDVSKSHVNNTNENTDMIVGLHPKNLKGVRDQTIRRSLMNLCKIIPEQRCTQILKWKMYNQLYTS